MEYRRPVERTFRNTLENTLGLVLASVTVSVALLPFISSALLPIPFGWVVGLWTSCLLLGVALAGGFALTSAIADRGISLGTDYFVAGIKQNWRAGLVVGVCTFLVALATALLIANPFTGIVRISVGLLGLYLFLGWWIWMSFSLPRLARDVTLQAAFERGGVLLLSKPIAGLWLLIQAVGLILLSVVTIITPFILLPGVLMLLSTQIVKNAE